jgi:imidazolonepropionase-like amidohydrolase
MTRHPTIGRAACAALTAMLALAIAASAPLGAQRAGQPAAPAALALTHATLIDGTGAPPRPGTTVLIRNGVIAAVQPDGGTLPPGAAVEDLTGRFVIPGLIDAHVHITGGPTTIEQYTSLLDSLLAHGVTGIRDMAGDARILSYLAREARLGERPWPNIYYSALMAGPTFFAEDPRVPGASEGVLLGAAPWMRSVDAATDIPTAVADAKGTGATGVKLYANLPAALVKAIAAEAHRQGLLVWTHATIFPAKPSDAIAAGADSISHTPYLVWQAAPKVPQDYGARAFGPYLTVRPDDPRILAALDAAKAGGTVLDATVRVFEQEAARSPRSVGDGIVAWTYAVTKLAHDRGVLVDAGTDSGGLARAPGGSGASAEPAVLDELGLLVAHCGFTPLEAIHAATEVNALVVGQAARRGTVTANKAADLVVLAADPTADIHNLTTVVEVFKDGRKIGR